MNKYFIFEALIPIQRLNSVFYHSERLRRIPLGKHRRCFAFAQHDPILTVNSKTPSVLINRQQGRLVGVEKQTD